MSYEKFMMDADMCGMLHSYLDGIVIDDTTLAFDAFDELGPGNHFLGCAHTIANYKGAFWESTQSDNEPFEKWQAAGSAASPERANRAWKKSLAEYEAPPLDESTDEELQAFITRRKAEMADAWY